MSEPQEVRTRWRREDDPFLGAVLRIYGLERANKDYVALLIGLDAVYDYARCFVRVKNGVATIPAKEWDAAPVEVRLSGSREYFRLADGKLEPISASQVREQIAMYLFSRGLPLHPEDP